MKIAIVKLSALGDIVHAMLALQFIKAAYPSAEIDWLVESRFMGVLADNPDIHRILPVNIKALKSDKRLIMREIAALRSYAATHYHYVIDAQGLLKSAIVARFLSANCFGFDKNSIRESLAARLYSQTVACAYTENTIIRNLSVLTKPLALTISHEQILLKQPFLFYQPPSSELKEVFSSHQAKVLLVIGSTWPSRNYPKEQYLEVIRGLNAQCLISWGNEQEYQSARWLAEHSHAKVLPKLSLNDLKAAVAWADLTIGNDTGPTHMAWGLNRPSITLFGPTPISRVYQTPINKVLKSPSEVNPLKLNKNDFSIKDIEARTVISLGNTLLQQSNAATH